MTNEAVVVFVHGHPFDRSMWQPQLADLPPGWRALAPDLRGYGQGPSAGEKVTLAEHAADLVALLDQQSIAQAVFVGLSMGGQIVMELVRAHEPRVRGIALAATFSEPETADGKRNRQEMAARLEREGMSKVASELLPRMLAASSLQELPGVRAHVLRMMEQAPAHGAAASLRGRAERPDYDQALRAFAKPALVVAGSEDAYTTRAQAERLRDRLRGELLWLEGAGHMPNLERTPEFNAKLHAFLAAL